MLPKPSSAVTVNGVHENGVLEPGTESAKEATDVPCTFTHFVPVKEPGMVEMESCANSFTGSLIKKAEDPVLEGVNAFCTLLQVLSEKISMLPTGGMEKNAPAGAATEMPLLSIT